MGRLNLEYFLARRIATQTGGRKNNVMVRIATLSVADRHRRNDHIAQRDFRIQARDRRETERIRLPCSDRQSRRERFVRNGSHFEKPAVPVANPQRAEFFGNVSLCRHDRHSARRTRDAGRRTEGSGQHVRLVVFPTKPRGGRTARRAKRRPHQGYRGLPFAGGPARSFGRGSAGNAVHPGSAAARPLPGRGHLRHAVQRNRPHDGADRPTQRPATQRMGIRRRSPGSKSPRPISDGWSLLRTTSTKSFSTT